MSQPHNLVNLNGVSKSYAAHDVLERVTLGVSAGERIGVVGGNGEGKSTLLALIAGREQPDAGTVVRERGLSVGLLAQADQLERFADVRRALVGDRAQHEWAADRELREVVTGLLGGTGFDGLRDGLDTPIASLSGGERRRIALTRLLLDKPELLALDEPTNHLDVQAIAWLAAHLAARRGTLLVVTHDRWFLDEVSTATWEIADHAVHQYDGGYAAYVLARAERERLAATGEERRRQLVRKELAWLRRGPPARTSKPKFRIAAANALIADEPPARDRTELLRFATSRLGDKVLDAEALSFAYPGQAPLLDDLTWRLGPGDRVALVGPNGSGKTTLLGLLAGHLTPSAGRVQRGQTVRLARLSQHPEELPPDLSVLAALEQIRRRATLAGGVEVTAGRLAERFGFRGERARTPMAKLSGGERRRLSLMRLLMGEPNVLLLDEPTNDLDIDTLTALEDLLDGWPGTLIVVSHDRYFIERVCDNVYGLTPHGRIRHLPGGVEQYLSELAGPATPPQRAAANEATPQAARGGGARRAARKELARVERALERLGERETALELEMAAHATDATRLGELTASLAETRAEREALEADWLAQAETLEG